MRLFLFGPRIAGIRTGINISPEDFVRTTPKRNKGTIRGTLSRASPKWLERAFLGSARMRKRGTISLLISGWLNQYRNWPSVIVRLAQKRSITTASRTIELKQQI